MALSTFSAASSSPGMNNWSPNQNPRAGMDQVPSWNPGPSATPATPAPGPVNYPYSATNPTNTTSGAVPNPGPADPFAPNPLDVLLQQIRASYQPQLDALQQQRQMGSDLGMARDSYYGGLTGLTQQGYSNDLAHLGSQRRLNDIDLGTARGNLPLLDQIMALGGQGMDLQRQGMGLQQQDLDLLRQSADMQKGYHGLNTVDLWNNLAQIGLQSKQQTQQAHSAGVAGGFGMAPGVATGLNQIEQDKAGKVNAAHNAYDTKELGLNVQDVGNQRSILGGERGLLDSQRGILDSQQSQIRSQMQRNMSQGQIDSLEEKAKAFGTDATGLYLGLQKSLMSLGLDRFTNANDILKMASSSSAQEAGIGTQILQELYTQAMQRGLDPGAIDSYVQGVTGQAPPAVPPLSDIGTF